MDSKGSRPGGRSARVRETVLGATLALLDEGRAHASIPEIAERAQIAPSSIYRRWGSWENLMAEALLDSSEAAIPVPDTGTIRGDLIAFAEALAAYLISPRGTALATAAVVMGQSDDFDKVRSRFWGERFLLGNTMVERAIQRGELPRGTDSRLLLEMVVAPLHLRCLLLHTDPSDSITEQVDLLLNGIRRPS